VVISPPPKVGAVSLPYFPYCSGRAFVVNHVQFVCLCPMFLCFYVSVWKFATGRLFLASSCFILSSSSSSVPCFVCSGLGCLGLECILVPYGLVYSRLDCIHHCQVLLVLLNSISSEEKRLQ
jgi:hypothetical protein